MNAGTVEQARGETISMRRRLGRVAMLAVAAAALAACGGGGGDDGGGGGGGESYTVACSATNASSAGYGIGICTDQKAVAFQSITTQASVDAARGTYSLTLTFPAGHRAEPYFGPEHKTYRPGTPSDKRWRNFLGALRGIAYENPLHAPASSPYSALTSFHRYTTDLTALGGAETHGTAFTYIDFGLWEKRGPVSDPNGYYGPYVTKWDPAAIIDLPNSARTYTGKLVGVLGPHIAVGDMRPNAFQYGFSGEVKLTFDNGQIVSPSSITDLKVSYLSDDSGGSSVVDLGVSSIDLVQTSAAGSTSIEGTATPSSGGSGAFEAAYYGAVGNPGVEIAGRIRFQIGNTVAVGAFGASRN